MLEVWSPSAKMVSREQALEAAQPRSGRFFHFHQAERNSNQMATDKQIAANRANALHSTGPRTGPGKTAAAQNAVKHHLTSKGLIILPGQEDAFDELESGLRAQLVPVGLLQEIVFKRAVESAWNLERCRAAEQALVDTCKGQDPLQVACISDRHAGLQRYFRQSEISFYKALRELGKLQAEVEFRRQIEPIPAPESQVCLLSQVMKHVIATRKNVEEEIRNEPISRPTPDAKEPAA